MTVSQKKERLAKICELLKEIYPDASCALEYGGDPWKLLIMGRLSAQCTDARVNIVCKELFSKYPNCASMASAAYSEVEEIVKPCGLFRVKAKNIVDASAMLIDTFGGRIPDNMEDMLRLPGVGRKIANLLLGDIYGEEAIVADTHCIRICGRLGMYPETLKDPYKVEMKLRSLMPHGEGSDFCHRIVNFGRDVCIARSPRCNKCPMAEKGLCLHAEKAALKNN